MTRYSVTFETKCYEKDWEILLRTGRLESMIRRNLFDFAERILYINNVSDPERVRFYAERLKTRGVITDHVLVDDYADAALAYFGLDRDSFKGGYYYSIQELVGIYRCRTDYLLHFSGDSILNRPFSWLDPALAKMNDDSRVKVATCLWNDRVDEAEAESLEQDGDFWLGYGFSDQCYLVRAADFKAPIYGERHPDSERFPVYGGELFEKRVDAWLRSHSLLRAVYRHASYRHKNFPGSRLLRNAGRLLGLYDCKDT